MMILALYSEDKSMIIVDNSDFNNLNIGLGMLHKKEFVNILFHGLGALNPYSSNTSVFLKDLEF
jgi:hypothetical protein